MDSVLDRLPFNARLIDRVVGNNVAGCDKKGRPIYIEKSGSVHVDAFLSCFTDDDILMAHLWQQENSVRRAAESSKQRGEHVELFTQILDLNGLSMATQRATKFTKMIVANDNAFYPERLGDLFVINAPWVFPVLWNIVKGWIDPVTRSKIHVLKGDPRETLLAHIDASQLPAEYGGTCNSCPNSPDCCKSYPLSEFVALLPLRESELAEAGLLVPETVKSGKNHKATLELAAGEVAEWFWTLKEKEDIDWSVEFVPADEDFKVRAPHASAIASGAEQSRAGAIVLTRTCSVCNQRAAF